MRTGNSLGWVCALAAAWMAWGCTDPAPTASTSQQDVCTRPHGRFESIVDKTVDQGAQVRISGWVADANVGVTGLQINVYVDGNFVTQVYPSIARPDVVATYQRPDFLYSGWTATIPTSNLSTGSHTILVWMGGANGGCGWIEETSSLWDSNTFNVVAPLSVAVGTRWTFSAQWSRTQALSSAAPVAANFGWHPQYDVVASPTTAPLVPDLAATLTSFASTDWVTTWGSDGQLARGGTCCTINARGWAHPEPSYASDKVFIAPRSGWYHLRADSITSGAAGQPYNGDGALVEVYVVSGTTDASTGTTTTRVWAALMSSLVRVPGLISTNLYLNPGDRLVVRVSSHSPDNSYDGINVDPWVQYLASGLTNSRTNPPCSVTVVRDTTQIDQWHRLRKAISDAGRLAANGTSATCPRAEVIVPAGDWPYAFLSFRDSDPHPITREFVPVSHVTLRGDYTGNKARLLLTDRTQTLAEISGDAVEIRGIELDYKDTQTLPFTQGTVMQVDTSPRQIHVAIDDGFDNVLTSGVWAGTVRPSDGSELTVQGIFFDPSTGRVKHYSHLDSTRTYTKDPNGYWILPLTDANPALRTGDRVAIMLRGHDSIHVAGNETALTDVVIRAGRGMGAEMFAGSGFHARRLTIAPAPGRLISNNGDGLHLKNLGRGPTVEGCDFSGMADDGINTHSDRGFAGTAADWCAFPGLPGSPVAGPCASDQFNLTASAEGLIVRDSKFHDFRARGILAQGSYALITHNKFWNLSRYGVTNGDDPSGTEGPGFPYAWHLRNNCFDSTVDYSDVDTCGNPTKPSDPKILAICLWPHFSGQITSSYGTVESNEVNNTFNGVCH